MQYHSETVERLEQKGHGALEKITKRVTVEKSAGKNTEETASYPLILWCRWPESNRHDSCPSRDFKSLASANSATAAFLRVHGE
jgi:hypothetical protein